MPRECLGVRIKEATQVSWPREGQREAKRREVTVRECANLQVGPLRAQLITQRLLPVLAPCRIPWSRNRTSRGVAGTVGSVGITLPVMACCTAKYR